MKKLLTTVAVIATLVSPAYAYDFLFNGPSGTAISGSYFVSATAMSLGLANTTTPTGVVTGTIALSTLGAACILSNTTTGSWVKIVAPATACNFPTPTTP